MSRTKVERLPPLPEADESVLIGSQAYLAKHPDQSDVRALSLAYDIRKLLDPAHDRGRAVLPEAENVVRKFVRAVVNAERRTGVSVRTVRLTLRGAPAFIKSVVKRRRVRPDAAGEWLGRVLEAFAAKISRWFEQEHLRRTPPERARILNRSGADRNREMFILVELSALAESEAERTVRLLEPILRNNPHVFIGLTASTESNPASATALRAAAHEVRLLGTDAARVGINFLPPQNGAFYPGTSPTRHGGLTAGVADAEILNVAILEERRRGGTEASVEDAMVTAHARVLSVAGEIGQRVATECGFIWLGISPVAAPVNCSSSGSAARRSSWAAMEGLNGAPVGSTNVVPATARFNTCLLRAGQKSGQKICGFVGSFNPPAEDGLLAQRVREARITVSDLILQETVSSAGVDMVILDPDTTADQIADLYADVACISDQWSKPLTVRVIVPPATARRGPNGDVHLGGLLGEGPTAVLARSYGSDQQRRFGTMGRLQRSTG